MTDQHQGPGRWQQGDREQALDWLANLDPRQQQALQRSIQTHQALGPIYDATNRVIRTTQRTASRLSDYAQRLAGGARSIRESAVTAGQSAVTAGQSAIDRRIERGQDLAARATEMGQRGRDNVGAAAEWTVTAAAGIAHRAVDKGTAAVGKVSRWFKEKQTNTSIRANAARAAFQAFRTDPALQQTVGAKDVKVLSEQATAISTATNWEELSSAIQQFGQSADQRLGGQTGESGQPGQTGQPGQSGQAAASEQAAGADNSRLLALALSGNADARGAVSQTPAQKAASQAGEQVADAQVPGGQAAGGQVAGQAAGRQVAGGQVAGGRVTGGQNQGQGPSQGQGEAPKRTGGKHRAGPVNER